MATKGVARILMIIAVILVVGGLLLVAYRRREGAAGAVESAVLNKCMLECEKANTVCARKYHGRSSRTCEDNARKCQTSCRK